jgi:ribonuclease T1
MPNDQEVTLPGHSPIKFMSNKQRDPNKKQSRNRPTDPFGGPANGKRNTISFGVVIVVFAFFLFLQYTNGDLSLPTTGPNVLPTTIQVTAQATVQADNRQPTPNAQNSSENGSPTVEAAAATLPAPAKPSQARATESPRATLSPTATANAPPAARASDLPTIGYDALPAEAHDTILLIEQGGPFPFSRDGVTFQNRERLLPRQPEGYYREYTVITPGENDRGARRIVTGEADEMYYTSDHYESFSEIIR